MAAVGFCFAWYSGGISKGVGKSVYTRQFADRGVNGSSDNNCLEVLAVPILDTGNTFDCSCEREVRKIYRLWGSINAAVRADADVITALYFFAPGSRR